MTFLWTCMYSLGTIMCCKLSLLILYRLHFIVLIFIDISFKVLHLLCLCLCCTTGISYGWIQKNMTYNYEERGFLLSKCKKKGEKIQMELCDLAQCFLPCVKQMGGDKFFYFRSWCQSFLCSACFWQTSTSVSSRRFTRQKVMSLIPYCDG